jgi:hypothetical protein
LQGLGNLQKALGKLLKTFSPEILIKVLIQFTQALCHRKDLWHPGGQPNWNNGNAHSSA